MPHGNHVAVAADDAGGIVEGFALGNSRFLDPGSLPDMPTQQVEGTTETHPGAGAGLEKQGSHDRAVQRAGYTAPVGIGLHTIGDGKDPLDIRALELADRQYVLPGEMHTFPMIFRPLL